MRLFFGKNNSGLAHTTIWGTLTIFFSAFTFTHSPPEEKPIRLLALNDVQVAVPGNFTAPFEYLNDIPTEGLDVDLDGEPDILVPCSCQAQQAVPNGENPNTGYFDDQVIVATGVSGQQWYIENSANIYDSSLQLIPDGTLLPEVGNTGVYVLPIQHQDANQYIATVESPLYVGEVFGPVTNTCFYPDPFIEGLDDTYCDSDPDFYLYGTVTSDFDDNLIPLTPVSEFWSIVRQEDGAFFLGTEFSPSTMGVGTYTVRYTADMGATPNVHPNKTGCTVTAEKEVIIRPAQLMACNGSINVTLPASTCEVQLIPEMLLSLSPVNGATFQIDVIALNGESIGDVIPAPFAGIPLTVRIQDDCSGDYCESIVTVNDITKPQLTIPADQTLACFEEADTSLTGVATATDCSPFDLTFSDEVIENDCGDPIKQVFRTWTATDDFGNSSTQLQTINIAQGTQDLLVFPADVDYTCEEYQADPSIVDGTPEGAGIPSVVDEPLCGFIYSYNDEVIGFCGDPNTSFVIVRTWLVLDDCGNVIYETDGNGNDNIQIIRVEDVNPPDISGVDFGTIATLSPIDNGLDVCTSVGFIPPPTVTDACNTFEVRIFTPLGEAIYVNGLDGADGGYIPDPGLPLGTHDLTYEAEDACGNTSSVIVQLTVEDDISPMMICDNSLFVTLSSNGTGRIYPSDIDEGSRDECCLGLLQVKIEGEEDNLFRNYINLDCVDDTINVILRATDCAGNYNECTSVVMIDDPIGVSVQQEVSNVSVSCQDDYSNYLEANYGAPVFTDNCTFTIDFSVEENIDSCGIGTLTRTWTAQDHPGNSPVSVQQIVSIDPVHDYEAFLPPDATRNCNDIYFTELSFESYGCDQVTWSVQESIIPIGGDSFCYTIVRSHEIINWCEYDGTSDPFQIPRWDGSDPDGDVGDAYQFRSDGVNIYRVLSGGEEEVIGSSTGYYQYRQMIHVVDNEPPAITFTAPGAVCTSENSNCAGSVAFTFVVNDDCGDTDNFMISHQLALNGENYEQDSYGILTYEGEDVFWIEGDYPVGEHSFEITAIDACGNESIQAVSFMVEDCTVPVLDCGEVSIVTLAEGGAITISPEDLSILATDECTTPTLSFSADSVLNTIIFDCESIGTQTIDIWGTDEAGNQSYCSAQLSIQDGSGDCTQLLVIDGQMRDASGVPVSQVDIQLTGPLSQQTQNSADGWYEFLEVPEGNGYKVIPSKNINHGNGVSTFDIIQVRRHIIGVDPLDSPYKLIAADANRSANVSTLDIIHMRRLILGIDSVFTDNTSWRFVPESYTFSNPADPFPENFPEDVTIMELNTDTTIHFRAIKVGDVNENADPQELMAIEEREEDPVVLLVEEGPEGYVTIRSEEEIMGCQFTLQFDPKKLAFLGLAPNGLLKEENLGLSRVSDGIMTLSWESASPVKPAFSLRFDAQKEEDLRKNLWMSSFFTTAEAYVLLGNQEIITTNLALSFTQSTNIRKFVILPSEPNPFQDFTNIGFIIPEPGLASIEIRNISGQIIRTYSREFEAGSHQVKVFGNDLSEDSGLLFYTIKTKFGSGTGKIIKISH